MMHKTVQCVEVEAKHDLETKEVVVYADGEDQPIPDLEVEFRTGGDRPGLYLRQNGSDSYHRIENLDSLKVRLRFREIAYTRRNG